MKAVYTLFLFVLPFLVQAQQAPNFQVVDINGVEHDLYEDHLDQGETMILAFFYSDCAICSALFDHLEFHMSNTWGALPVKGLVMSGVDSSQDLYYYQSQTGIDLPLVGVDGGAADAMAPYMNPNDWGTFYGYPMFIVIGANREVVYDPWGVDIEDTMFLLGEAIQAVNSVSTANVNKPELDFWVAQASNGLNIDLDGFEGRTMIHDLRGQLLFEGLLREGKTNIELGTLASQILVVSVLTNEGKRSKQLFYQHNL
ncbi:MAG: hypothetical protein NWS86_07565 [Flavobacteriales bacterium]|nr:hypothetical protein [Flavobacteriales bacterium]